MMILSLRKPTVLIDVTRSPQSGIGTYSWNLLRHLQRSTREYTFLGLTKPQHEAYARANGLNTIIFPREPRTPTEILQLSHLISKSADVYVATGFTQMVFPRIPVIQVVHDLIYMSHPEWQPTEEDFQISHGKTVIQAVRYGLLPLFKLLVRRQHGRWRSALGYSPLADLFVLGVSCQILRAKAIVTVSNTTRDEVLKRYDLSHPIRTIYPIIPYSAKTSEAESSASALNILYIANFEPRKNHCAAFEAVAALPDELRRKTRLLLIGKSAYNSHEQAFRRHLAWFEEHIQVEIYQGIPEDEKERLFARSALLLFPSLAEGFGIPLLEAMQRGLPIIAYDTPIAREICGDGARYVGTNHGTAFAEAIVEVYKNGAHAMRPAQQKQVRKFANSQAGETMTNLLRRIL
jgi:glycosyltransferase involved in cell wall biosynthesis